MQNALLRFQGTERDEILTDLRKRLGLPPLDSAHQQQHPLPGSNPNVKWHRPGKEVVKGAPAAPHPGTEGGSYMPAPPYKAPLVGQHAPKTSRYVELGLG